jgi:glycosyltransferase involved in cell wall biosynthesis
LVTPDPKLAVVISCYNYEAFVGEAIASVLSQLRDDCELVVVDDGSTDGSWGVISRSGARAWRTENRGQAAACLLGLERTRAPFVLFLDADDALKPGALDRIVARLDPDLAKLQFGLSPIDAEGRPLARATAPLEAFRGRDELLGRVLRTGVYRTPPTSGNVFRRDLCELLREVDYDPAVDGVILFAAPLFGDVLSLPEELGLYRIHGRMDSGLGGPPKAAILERDLARFVARTRHLATIVRRMTGHTLVEPEDAFFYQERLFYLDIIRRRRPGVAQTWRLAAATLREEGFSLPQKLALLSFVALVCALPRVRALPVLAYRLQAGRRSALGLLRQAVVPPAAV